MSDSPQRLDPPDALHASSAQELLRRIEAEREGLTFLVYRDGNGEQQIFPLREQVTRVVIGRDESAELRLDWDDQVSGLHAELSASGGSGRSSMTGCRETARS